MTPEQQELIDAAVAQEFAGRAMDAANESDIPEEEWCEISSALGKAMNRYADTIAAYMAIHHPSVALSDIQFK